jgi:L-arabinokinase
VTTDAFVRLLRAQSDLFDPTGPIVIARAPGRLDLMGGIADYSGSLVLQLPLACTAYAAAQWADSADHGEHVTVRTAQPADIGGTATVRVPLADLLTDYDRVRARLAADPRQRWAGYVVGGLTALHRERRLPLTRGVTWFVASDVPPGKGVSSSAALEVAAMQALAGLLGPAGSLAGRDLALLCQIVENRVVGAPCGVMDQMTAALGEAGTLLALRCQPAEVEPPVRLPDEVEVFGIDSGIRHAVSGADYGSVRVGAFMGYRIIAALAGLQAGAAVNGQLTVDDPRWHGYLANVTTEEWAREFQDRVPERMAGAEFLRTYGGLTDTVTRVDPGGMYAVRQPTAHPIFEHARVQRFRALLEARPLTEDGLVELGALMFESHASYSACGLGSDGTDAIVELVRAAGPSRGLYGAKITGGGSGGTVAVLARRGHRAAVDRVAAAHAAASGRQAAVISGSSDGAVRFGVRLVLASDG